MVISTRSEKKVYHWEFCPYAKRISDNHKKILTPDQARSRGYKECSWCGKSHGLFIRLRDFPAAFPDELSKMSVSYDKKLGGICFKTNLGFWKILWNHNEHGFRLYHLNESHFDPEESSDVMMHKNFHRQKDVETTQKIGRIIRYIYEHDKAKRIMKDDWRKLPRQTQQQRDYFNKKKKKERRKAIWRVNKIIEQLEKERINKNG